MATHVKTSDAAKFHAHWIVYLHEVVRCGSIRRAAQALNVAPSAISRRLSELETLLGERLLERVPRGLRLTSAGHVVAEHAERVLRELGHMRSSLDELRGLERGHVNVAAVPSAAVELLPRIVAGFRRTYPNITFDCTFSGSGAIAEQVLTGDSDIGIAFSPPKLRGLRNVSATPLSFGAIMNPRHRLAQRKSVRIADLIMAKVPFIFPDDTISTRSVIQDAIRRSARELEPAVTSLNRDFVIGMAQFGDVIAVRTPLGIERELRDGSLVFVPIKEPRLRPRLLTVLTHASRPLSLAALLFLDAARDGVAGLRTMNAHPERN